MSRRKDGTRIQVTAQDIKRGKPCDSDRCPVAIALRRETKRKWRVGRALAALPGSRTVIRLPKRVTDKIYVFDDDGPMKPFAFTFHWPLDF
jgi:hypothetical protein